MKNFLKRGNVIDYANAGADIDSGDFVIIGAMFGVAQTDIPANTTGAVLLEGVFSLAKAAQAFSQGAKLYWDATNHVVTTTTTSNTFIGFAHVAALSGDATAAVQLANGI